MKGVVGCLFWSLLAVPAMGAENIDVAPPMARIVPTELEKHGDVRIDDYYWLRERENPDVVSYLEKENAYTRHVLAHTEELQETLFKEIKGHLIIIGIYYLLKELIKNLILKQVLIFLSLTMVIVIWVILVVSNLGLLSLDSISCG